MNQTPYQTGADVTWCRGSASLIGFGVYPRDTRQVF